MSAVTVRPATSTASITRAPTGSACAASSAALRTKVHFKLRALSLIIGWPFLFFSNLDVGLGHGRDHRQRRRRLSTTTSAHPSSFAGRLLRSTIGTGAE